MFSFTVYNDNKGVTCVESMLNDRELFRGKTADAINEAIQSVPKVHGAEFRILAGKYILEKPIIIDRHGISLTGEGRKASTYGGPAYIKAVEGVNAVEIRMPGERIRGVTISNLSFFGENRNSGTGIFADGCSDMLTIQNVGVYNFGTGIYLKGGPAGAVDAAQLVNADPQQCGRGLVLEYCHYTKVTGGEYSDNETEGPGSEQSCGIFLTSNDCGRTISTKITGITAVRNGGPGIYIGKGCVDISVTSGTDLGGNKWGGGIFISDEGSGDLPDNIIVSGIHSYNNNNAGICIDGASNVVVNGCIISVHDHPHVDNAGQFYGISVKNHSGSLLLDNNIMYGNLKDNVCFEARPEK